MTTKKIRTCDQKEWERTVRFLVGKKEGYGVITKGSRKNMLVKGKIVRTTVIGGFNSKLSKEEIAFIARFSRELKNKIMSSEELMFKAIKKPSNFHYRHQALWNKIPIGTFFYGYDIISAYWISAYKLGYISKSFYERYFHNENLKMAKRLCFSWLARNSKCTWFDSNGAVDREIKCINTLFQKVYDNIRYFLYNIMNSCKENMPKDTVLMCNIDAIYVVGPDHKNASLWLNDMDIPVKGTLCRKISSDEYTHGTEVRLWKGVGKEK